MERLAYTRSVPVNWHTPMEKKQQPREYVAYEGRKFTVEWYYDRDGHSQALDYAESLDSSHQRKLLELFKLLGDIGQVTQQTEVP
jgi:hypothetical protein